MGEHHTGQILQDYSEFCFSLLKTTQSVPLHTPPSTHESDYMGLHTHSLMYAANVCAVVTGLVMS